LDRRAGVRNSRLDARRSGDFGPVLQDDGLPLGLQLLGFADADAALFSTAGGVLALLQQG
jgi:hypothetical protein